MLHKLSINNFALIDHLQINFEDGFSVITGETGSGKSILLGALGLILGDRADYSSIRTKDKKCIIEGVFRITEKEHKRHFNRFDLDFELETIVRREISASGKSRAFINDTPVSLTILKDIGSQLIDIHSQHETLLLNNNQFVIDLLDSHHDENKTLVQYRDLFERYTSQTKKLRELRAKELDAQNQKDFTSFLLQEFEEYDLNELAENDIEEEYKLLANAETIKRSLDKTTQLLNDNSGQDAISSLKQAQTELQQLSDLSNNFQELYNRISSVIIELSDLENECSHLSDTTELDERKLASLENKTSFVNRLLHKHQLNDLASLQQKHLQLKEELLSIDSLSNTIKTLESDLKSIEGELMSLSKTISKNRKETSKHLTKEARVLLDQMNMKNADISFDFQPAKELNQNGSESVQILARTNLGGDFEPLKKIASGGETSRIMLAIKSLQSKKRSLPTIIFDEIDTGVSGDIASRMGSIMTQLGNKMQVISITHLPQIAAKGSHHFKVSKFIDEGQTFTRIEPLKKEERQTEIAQLLSGSDISKAALKNALELLKAK